MIWRFPNILRVFIKIKSILMLIKMRRKEKIMVIGLIIGAVLIFSGIAVYHSDEIYLSKKNMVLASLPEAFFSNTNTTFLLIGRDINGNPASGEKVSIELETDEGKMCLYEGKTDEDGYDSPVFTIPNVTGNAKLYIEVGGDDLTQDIVVEDNYKIIISTDKPIYQPGQIIHIRTLTFEGIPRMASQEHVEILLHDPDGNTIYKKIFQPNEYGVASTDIPLSDQLPLGNYKVVVKVGEEESQKSVTVKKYVLPKFSIDVTTAKPWCLINEPVNGTVKATYFWKEPVKGVVSLDAYVYLGIWEKIGHYEKNLSQGVWNFSLEPIQYAVGIPFEKGNGLLQLEVSIKDTSGHEENETHVLPISSSSLVLTTLSDTNIAGANSTYYVVVTTPDGMPVENADINATLDETVVSNASTNERGIATLTFPYNNEKNITIRVRKEEDAVTATYPINGTKGIKVIADKESYIVGEMATFQIYFNGESFTDWAYYDVFSQNFVVSTGRIKLHEGKGNFSITITPEMAPLTKIRAYKIQSNLTTIKDVTVIGVTAPEELKVNVTMDREEYRPHSPIMLEFSVENDTGPIVSALGISIVDQSVFELGGRFAGLEKLYFELEEEFITPQYEIHEYIFSNTSRFAMLSDTTNYVVKSDFGPEGKSTDPQKYVANAFLFKEKNILFYWTALFLLFVCGAIAGIAYVAIKTFGKKKAFLSAAIAGICLVILLTINAFSGEIQEMEKGEEMTDVDVIRISDANGLEFDPRHPQAPLKDDITLHIGNASGAGGEAPKYIRQYFPETWEWVPVIITDESGRAFLNLTTPDSITTWALEAIASTQDAQIGIAKEEITIFQEFFVEPDVPVSAVRGDEFPLRAMAYNYGEEAIFATVELIGDEWYSLLSPSKQTIFVEAHSVSSATFTIKPQTVGEQVVHIRATSGAKEDEIKKTMRIDPDGKAFSNIKNGELKNNQTIAHSFLLYPERIPHSENAFVKLQGGMQSIIIDGAEGFIHFVSGCGEQSMSMLSVDILAYQNVIKKEGVTDEQLFAYETMITQGIQHELLYVVDDEEGKGIVWFPHDEKPHPWLTSWGLLTFQDAINVGFTIDESIIEQMQKWLIAQQDTDGSYVFPEWGLYETTNPVLKMKKVATTAYITRALLYSGYEKSSAPIKKSLDYIGEHIHEHWDDPYTLSLALIAFEYDDGNVDSRDEIAQQLVSLRHEENDTVWWTAENTMYANSEWRGWYSSHDIETTAYAIMALQMHGGFASVVNKAVSYLLNHRSQLGGFSSTQDTVVAFQALNTYGSIDLEEMKISIFVNGGEIATIDFDEENKDVTYIIDLRPYLQNTINVMLLSNGTGNILYQIFLEQYLPWKNNIEQRKEIVLEVTYDATEIAVNDTINASVTLIYNGSADIVRMILIDIRAPVGFSFISDDFSLLLNKGVIDNFEIKGRQALIYIESLEKGKVVTFSYRLKANEPIKGIIQGVNAFDMYNTNIKTELPPVNVTVQ